MQLLAGVISCAKSKAEIDLPVISVRDWPDLAERGLWGGSANEDIEWLAERKMNLVESHANLSVNAEGHGVAVIPAGLVERARRHAIKLVPIITHLEQLPGEIFSRFPMLKGMGDEAAWRKIGKVTPACFSQPKLQEILADWLTGLARYSEVTDINVWLSENVVQCACNKCKAMNQFVLETRTVLRAWEAAKRVKPDLRLRLLLTQGSYESNDKVLAAVPRDVGITYYHGGKTYTCDRDPMIYPLLEKYAADGGWLGCYPTLTPSWAVVCPWSAPQFIKDRMTEFVNKKLTCLCGYATPSNRFHEFNISAAAEWSWNSAGRNEREFSLAWATRAKLSKPEKAAEWAVTLGPRGQDVYASQVPYSWFFGTVVADRLPKGLPPLGDELFRYLESEKKIEDNLAACGRAMALAREVNAPALIYETQTITGYMQMLKGLHQLSNVIAKKKTLNKQEKKAATGAMKSVVAASNAVIDGLERWQKTVAPKFTKGRVAETVQVTKQTATDVAAVLAKLNVKPTHKQHKR
jgi:hypothetical protein